MSISFGAHVNGHVPLHLLSERSSERITLPETDHSRLRTFIHSGIASARVRAQVLLNKLSEGRSSVE